VKLLGRFNAFFACFLDICMIIVLLATYRTNSMLVGFILFLQYPISIFFIFPIMQELFATGRWLRLSEKEVDLDVGSKLPTWFKLYGTFYPVCAAFYIGLIDPGFLSLGALRLASLLLHFIVASSENEE
jgi:fumarate reductase subunit C